MTFQIDVLSLLIGCFIGAIFILGIGAWGVAKEHYAAKKQTSVKGSDDA